MARAPKGKTWKQIFIDEVRTQISDQDWKRVHYLGRVPYDRFLSMIQVSRVHLYLTYPFVLSWSLLEAMSAGAAIVASDTAPVKEAMVDGQTGLFVDFFDRVGLVEKTCQLLDDKALREKLGTAARQHIVNNCRARDRIASSNARMVSADAGPDRVASATRNVRASRAGSLTWTVARYAVRPPGGVPYPITIMPENGSILSIGIKSNTSREACQM